MKKFLCLTLAIITVITMLFTFGCGKEETLKLGLGVYSYYSSVDNAEGDDNGKVGVVSTIAAVLVDADGKIVKCVFDCADNSAKFTSDGKFVSEKEFKTKYEAKDGYGMASSSYAQDINNDGVVKEWFEQADAFAALVVGKNADEVKALVADNGRGTDEVMTAGCTILVSDFALAVEKALAATVESKATASDTLKLGVVTTQSGKDAEGEDDGSNKLQTTFTAVASNADGKVTAMLSDCVEAEIKFDKNGVTSVTKSTEIVSKRTKGDSYNMVKYGTDLNGDGIVKEWYLQANEFDAACVGKTATEIAGLESNGYGVDSLKSAGCTMVISDFVKATTKALSAN